MSDKENKDEKLWTQDFKILFQKSFDILPNNSMSFNRKLNALTRFLIILSIMFFMMYGNKNVFFAPLVFMFFVYVTFAASDERIDTFINGAVKPENCKEPTINNPFMNLLLTDIHKENGRKESCDTDDVKEEITDNFNANLYFEADDIFQKNNSQRQFYTVPNTEVSNKQCELGQWLYGTGPTLKEKHIIA